MLVGYRKERTLPSDKVAYLWGVGNQSQAAGLMMTLLPLMGERRHRKIIECLSAWRAKDLRKSLWTHCKHGHPLSGDNLVIVYEGKYAKRRCRKCAAARQEKYRARLRA